MSTLYSVKAVAELLGCSNDTARARMRQMAGVMNVGTARRHQLMVTEEALDLWLNEHRMARPGAVSVPAERPRTRVTISADGKMARIDRRTGKLTHKKSR